MMLRIIWGSQSSVLFFQCHLPYFRISKNNPSAINPNLTFDKYKSNPAGPLYGCRVAAAVPMAHMPGQIIPGLRQMWNPAIILSCQILWIGTFLYMGRSQVTGAHIFFHVRKDRI
jgi:hypothetical protein